MATIGAKRRNWPKRTIQIGIYLSVLMGLVPFGAVHTLPKLFVAIVITLVTMMAIWLPVRNATVRRLIRNAWIILSLLVVFALFQSLTFENNPLAHPFWKSAGELAGFTHGAISVEPSLTRFSLLSLIPPFLLFIAILHSFQGDEEFWRLIKVLGIIALVFVFYGIAQAQLFPHYVFIRELEAPKRLFTSTLINRNHAATMAGLASLVLLAIIIRKARGIPFVKFPKVVFFPSRLPSKRRWPLVIWSVGLFFSLIALFMSQSRGGLGATVVAWGILMPPLLARALAQPSSGHTGFSTSRYFRLRRILLGLLLLIVAIGFTSIYAEGTLFRLADTNTEVGRFCNFPAMWRVFLDNWMLGAGFGTFEVIFPVYREAACGTTGIWTQAHNFWLEGLMGFGILFVPVALFCIWSLVDCFVTGIRTRRSQRFVSWVGLAFVVLIALHSFVEFSLQLPGVALYASACISAFVGLSLGRIEKCLRKNN